MANKEFDNVQLFAEYDSTIGSNVVNVFGNKSKENIAYSLSKIKNWFPWLVPTNGSAGQILEWYNNVPTWRANTNADTVKQTHSTDTDFHPLVLGAPHSASAWSGDDPIRETTDQVYMNKGIYVKPSTSTIYATDYRGKINGFSLIGTEGSTYNLNSFITSQFISSITTTGNGNGVTAIGVNNGVMTVTKGSTFELVGHTHPLSIATDTGNSQLSMSSNTKYKLTAGGSTFIFTTPPDSDTKVTSSTNHYTPATASGQDKTASASGATAAWSIDVVKGVTLNTDGKGHVTGISVTSGKIPANPVPSNNVTGSGTSGYLTKWSGTNTITNGPQLGSSTTTFLRNDGTWATPPVGEHTHAYTVPVGITIKTGSSDQSHITLQTLMNWLITTKGYITSNTARSLSLYTSWSYAGNDILQLTIDGTAYELQLAGVIIEFDGYASDYQTGTFRLRIHSSPTVSFTPASGYTQFPASHIAEYTCNGSGYSPTWKMLVDSGDKASTSAYGITKLYDGVNSTSTSLAATANAVKTAYDKGNHSHPYLPLAGGTMTGDITFTGLGNAPSSYPAKSKGIYWSGGTDSIDMYYNVRSADAGELIINMRDDTNVRTSFAYNGTVKSYIDTDGTYNGNATTSSRAYSLYTGDVTVSTTSHATALQTFFEANKSTIVRNRGLGYYSNVSSNGSFYFGYFLSGYDSNPYGGFFVCHYNNPYYVGIQNGTFVQHNLLTNQNYTSHITQLGTVSKGSTIKGIYLDAGVPKEMTYSLNSTVNGGTANCIAYYSGVNAISSAAKVTYVNANNSASTPASVAGLHIESPTYGNTAANMIGGVAGVFSYGDGGPQIRFKDASSTQAGALIFTADDAAAAGTSWHFVSNQTDWNVTSKRFHARTSISIGTDKPSTSYNLTVNGTSYFDNTITIKGTSSGNASINYASYGNTRNYTSIKFYDGDRDGHGVQIGGGGLTVVGGGESAQTVFNGLSTLGLDASSEHTIISADSTIYMMTCLDQGVANRQTFTFNTAGDFDAPRYSNAYYFKMKYTTTEDSSFDSNSVMIYSNSDGYFRRGSLSKLGSTLGPYVGPYVTNVGDGNVIHDSTFSSPGWSRPIHRAKVNTLRSNKLAFTKAANITVEYTSDGGSNWSTVTDEAVKENVFIMQHIGGVTVGPNNGATRTTSMQTRITITNDGKRDCMIDQFYIWATYTGHTTVCDIQYSTQSAKTTFVNWKMAVPVAGWSGPSIINVSEVRYGGTIYAIRLTFRITTVREDYKNSTGVIYDIQAFGGMANWSSTVANNMERYDHLYSWDRTQKAYFPNEISIPTQMRIVGSTYGMIIRNDNNYTYLLPTNANDPQGSWRAEGNGYYFPFYIQNSTGKVTMKNLVEIGGTLMLSKTTDAAVTSNNSPALIVGGTTTTPHIEIDNNEIIAKADGTTGADLYINSGSGGGYVFINDKLAAKFSAAPTSGQLVVTDGTTGSVKSSGYTVSSFVPNTQAGIGSAINLLESGTSTPTDNDYYISQWAGGSSASPVNTTPVKRTHSALWAYINGKISATTSGSGNAVTSVSYANGVITATKGSTFSLSTHTHSQYYDSTISRTANTVLAAPNGSNGAATFRSLVAADIPTLNYVKTFLSTNYDINQPGYYAVMANKTTENPNIDLPTASQWWHVLSMGWQGTSSDVNNWISQLAIPTYQNKTMGLYWRTNSGSSTALTANDWKRVYCEEKLTPSTTAKTRNILHIYGNTVGNTASELISGTIGVLSYGDAGPQINFSTSATIGGAQDSAIIWTDNDGADPSVTTGVSWHFVSKEADWNVISKRFHARTAITIGTDKPVANSYNLYVTGNGYFSSGMTSSGDIFLSDSSTTTRQIRGTVGGNDYWRIAGGATASNTGWMEIATADDGTEPIYVRQYTGVYTTITRTATLLDASGNTSFPGALTTTKTVSAAGTSTADTASASLYTTGAIEVRESGRNTTNVSDFKCAPRIGFHWGGRTAATLSYHSDGIFYFRKQDGTTRASIDANVVGSLTGDITGNASGYSNTVYGIYTGNGGVQAPNYFGKNRVGFLMSNVSITGDTHYKNIMYMDCYSGTDVGGVTALAIDRTEARAWILQSDANRTAWNNTAAIGVFTATPTTGQIVVTDGTTGGVKTTGYTTSSFLSSSTKYAGSDTVGGVANNSYYIGDSTAPSTYKLRYINSNDVTTWTSSSLAATDSIAVIRGTVTDAWTTGHIVTFNVASVGTPFQLGIHDSSELYFYKRYKSGSTWSGWTKMNAGNADTATYLQVVAKNEVRFLNGTGQFDYTTPTQFWFGYTWAAGSISGTHLILTYLMGNCSGSGSGDNLATVTAKGFVSKTTSGGAGCTMQYNSSTQSLDFVFS